MYQQEYEDCTMGKLTPLVCPNCHAALDIKGSNRILFCPFCGTSIDYDDGSINVNINANIHKINEKIDHTKIAELKHEDNESKRLVILATLCFAIAIITLIVSTIHTNIKKSEATQYISQGLVSPGEDNHYFKGKNKNAVIKRLEDCGFTNIDTVVVGTMAIWNAGDVTEVSINGRTDYSEWDYFDPDVPVTVSYK